MKTILIVDDEPEIRNLLVRFITLQGYLTLEAAGAAEAVKLVRMYTEAVDLAIIDQTLDDGRGVDVAARLTTIQPAMRVLLISGELEKDVLARVPVGRTMPGFLQKPFDRRLLLDRIQEILGCHNAAGS
jgi:two-component system response regulator ResD